MGLRPAGAQQQQELVEALRRRLRKDPLRPLAVVVPSWPAAVQLRRRLAEADDGRGGHVGLRWLTPWALVERLGGGLAVELGVKPLPPWGLELLAARLARRTATFGELARRPGFPELLAQTLGRLRRWGVTAADLRARAGHAADPAERQRWLDLAAIHEGAGSPLLAPRAVLSADPPGGGCQAWEGVYADGAALAALAVRAAAEGRAAELLGCDELWLWDVPQAWQAQTPLWGELVRRLQAGGCGLGTRRVPADPSDMGVAGLLPLEPGAAAAEARACLDELQEAREVARELLRAAEEGVAFWRMAVVLPQRHPYLQLVADALDQAGVPAHLSGGGGSAGPVARAVAGWLALLREGPSRPAILGWLRSAPLRPAPADGEPARWEALSVEAGLGPDPSRWADALQRWKARSRPTAAMARAADSLADVGVWVAQELQAMPRQGSWTELAEAVAGWMERRLQRADDFEAVRRTVLELASLEELERACGQEGDTVDLELFVEAASHALRRGPGQPPPERRFEQGCVAVLSGEEALGCSFDVVCVAGLARGRVPAPLPPQVLLGAGELEELAGLSPGSLAAAHARHERRLFAWAVTSARRRCLLTYPAGGGGAARSSAPSPFLQELERRSLLDHGADDGPESGGRRLGATPVAPPALDVHEWHRWLAVRRGPGATRWLAGLYPQAGAGDRLHRARTWGPPGPADGLVGPAAAQEAASASGPVELGPTELEAYARCPRLYFFSRLLGVEPSQEPEAGPGLAGPVRGRVAHLALRELWEAMGSPAGGDPARLPSPGEVVEAVARAAEQVGWGSADLVPGGLVQLQALAEVLRRLLASELALPGGGDRVAARWLEHPFEGVSVPGPHGEGMRLRGRMDRLELLEGRGGRQARVVDYKTGRPTATGPEDLKEGLQLQPAVYLLAASHLTGLPCGSCRVAMVYLDTPALPRWLELDGARWDQLHEAVGQVLEVLAEGLRQGYFAPDPHPEVSCEQCSFYLLCGQQPQRFRERQGPAAFAALERLRRRGP